MFKLFKRNEPPAPPRRATPATRTRPAVPDLAEPLPVPEVVEDHDESAWSQWEESQFQLDSQMGGLSPLDSVKVRGGGEKGPEPDPFQSVRSKDR